MVVLGLFVYIVVGSKAKKIAKVCTTQNEKDMPPIRSKPFLLLSAILIITLGCALPGFLSPGKDTCAQGDNMSNPRLVAGLEESGETSRIRITWEPGTETGAELPVEYFQAVSLEGESDVVSTVTLTAEREITVEFNDLSSYLKNEKVLELTLRFPDRREYISCHHAGMDDVYYLKISIHFTPEGTLEETIFEQGVRLGPI